MTLPHRLLLAVAFALVISMSPRLRAGALAVSATEKHWAFQPVRRPEVPVVTDRAWASNPIDRFVMARLEAEGTQAGGRGRPPDFDPSALSRPDRPAANAREVRDISSMIDPPTPLPGWSTICWPARSMASAGRGIGSTSSATPKPTVTSATAPSRMPGGTVTT